MTLPHLVELDTEIGCQAAHLRTPHRRENPWGEQDRRVISYSTPGNIPPSISMVVPLMKSAAPEARKAHVRPTSEGSPPRLRGTARK